MITQAHQHSKVRVQFEVSMLQIRLDDQQPTCTLRREYAHISEGTKDIELIR